MTMIEASFVTSFILLITLILVLCAVVWFVARGKYKNYTKTTIIQELQESIDILNQLTHDEKEEVAERIRLRSEISALRERVCFLSKYCCLDNKCPKRIEDDYILELGQELEKEIEEESLSDSSHTPQITE